MFGKSYGRLKILVILFPIIAGVFSTVFGLIAYGRAQTFNREDRPITTGFLVFSSMELHSFNMSIQIIELDFELDRSGKSLIMFDFESTSPLTGEQVMGFQFPYVLEEFEFMKSDVPVTEKEILKENITRPDTGLVPTGVAILYFRFVANPEKTHYSFSASIKWSGLLSKTEYATYKLVIPFARDQRALRSSITNLFPNAKIRYITQNEGDHVSVQVTAAASLKAAYPLPTSVMGFHEYNIQMLTWELGYHDSTVTGMQATLDEVVAYFEISSEAEQRNRYLYEAGIYSGLGVSLLFSGIYEALKVLEESRRRTRS